MKSKSFFTPDESYRVARLSLLSKSGGRLTSEEMDFIQAMYHKNPKEYRVVQAMSSKKAVEEYLRGMGL